MIKRWVIGVLWVALLLASCQSSDQPQATPTELSKAEAPATQAVSTATQESASSSSAPVGCTVISPRPTPGATERSIFPVVSGDDWVTGPSDAAITFVEYSDFQ